MRPIASCRSDGKRIPDRRMSSAKLGQYCCPNTYDKILPRIQGGITAKSDCAAIFSRRNHRAAGADASGTDENSAHARNLRSCAVASREADGYRSEP
jgi:hypothetical protein